MSAGRNDLPCRFSSIHEAEEIHHTSSKHVRSFLWTNHLRFFKSSRICNFVMRNLFAISLYIVRHLLVSHPCSWVGVERPNRLLWTSRSSSGFRLDLDSLQWLASPKYPLLRLSISYSDQCLVSCSVLHGSFMDKGSAGHRDRLDGCEFEVI